MTETENQSQENFTGSTPVKKLREAYNVSKPTWKIWLSKIPDLNLNRSQRLYTPIQVKIIISHLGEPG